MNVGSHRDLWALHHDGVHRGFSIFSRLYQMEHMHIISPIAFVKSSGVSDLKTILS